MLTSTGLICCAASSSRTVSSIRPSPAGELRKPPVRVREAGIELHGTASLPFGAGGIVFADQKAGEHRMCLREGIVLIERLRELRATPFNRFLKGERAFGAEPERGFGDRQTRARAKPGSRSMAF